MTMEVGKVSINKMGFEETELRLGLPGNAKKGGDHQHQGDQVVVMMMRNKRGFSETVDLKLNFSNPSKDGGAAAAADHDDHDVESSKDSTITGQKNLNLAAAAADAAADPAKPPAKAQVVGWPPVRSFRKNMLATQKTSDEKSSGGNARFVKVSMDGAPYLRKVDLKMYTTYHQLSDALSSMFSSFTIGSCGSQGMRDYFSNESKLMDLLNGTDYVPTYEDKDGDWMLVGDVPWEMFVESCKRLRIMKGKEATGLAPRAMEKCKNRGLINN